MGIDATPPSAEANNSPDLPGYEASFMKRISSRSF